MCCGSNTVSNTPTPVQETGGTIVNLNAVIPASETDELVFAHEKTNDRTIILNGVEYGAGFVMLVEFKMTSYSREDSCLRGYFRFMILPDNKKNIQQHSFNWILEKIGYA